LHGDVKPANILVGRAEVPIIVDFMIPDLQRVVFGFTDHWVKRDDGTYFYNSPLTAAYGTPGYMPPEQLVEGIVTAPSDVYALGRTFVDLFWANEEEFSRDLMSKTGVKAVNRQLAHLVKQMTRPQPEERPQSMREITEALQRLSGGIKRNWVGDFGRLFRRRRGF
jgi:serine/threonine protein kinase